MGVFATIGRILAYTDHTTPPTMWDSLITQSGFFSSQQLQRYGEEAIAEITVYAEGASPYPQPERGQSKPKSLTDTTSLQENNGKGGD